MKSILKYTFAGAALLAAASFCAAATPTENWDQHCAKCHGANGNGDTKMGKKLKVKDYTDAKSLAGMSDVDIRKAIADGVHSKDGKPLMTGYKDKLSEDEIMALVTLVKSFSTAK